MTNSHQPTAPCIHIAFARYILKHDKSLKKNWRGFVCINYHSVESPNCETVKTKWFQVVLILLMETTKHCSFMGPFSGEKAKDKEKTSCLKCFRNLMWSTWYCFSPKTPILNVIYRFEVIGAKHAFSVDKWIVLFWMKHQKEIHRKL